MIYTIIGGVSIVLIAAIAMYRAVPSSEAHYIVSPEKTMVCSPDTEVSGEGGSRWYFKIPILRKVRVMDITIKELVVSQETYEKNQARYNVKSSIKFRIKKVRKAAETFVNDTILSQQLVEVVKASVRAVTVKYDVVDVRANKKKMSEEIRVEIVDDLAKWGLELVSFQLIDFQDTENSTIISDISKRREVEIQSRTRQENAEKIKEADIKEAAATEASKTRQIQKEEVVGKREQDKLKAIAIQRKEAREQEYEVIRVEQVKQAEIDKEKAIVKANEDKETELIRKEQKRLEGEGDKLRAEEIAKGEAAPIREKGFADAEAKEKLQEALKKFDDNAIRALVAEKIVAMQKEVGIAGAQALEKADLKVFAGGDGPEKDGFDVGKLMTAITVGNESIAQSILNRLGKPNDLGINFGGSKVEEPKKEDKAEKPKEGKPKA
ncbi:hypothetical protein LCGC14_2005700 [marine sediment metagenome]|uniref:Band 7 domain-containing protein n=1 Tax=marine sediment metagenome TaxID=412755 RepID=A0A0F9F1Y3_9ZZZZ